MRTEEYEMWASDKCIRKLRVNDLLGMDIGQDPLHKNKVKIIIEKPERKGTITESQFDDLAYHRFYGKTISKIKKEIFGEDE